MALPSNGPISMSMVRTELELGNLTNFRLNGAELCDFTDLNNLSISQSNPDKPNIDTPNSASEWYGYDHKYKKTLNNNLSFNNILASAEYQYSTFTTIDINETENLYINFTGSDFVNTGTAPVAAVSYSLYYGTYSLDIPNSKLIKTGSLTSTNNSDSFLYEYNSSSGSNVTWIWRDTGAIGGITCTNDNHVIFKNESSERRDWSIYAAADGCRGSFDATYSFAPVGEVDLYPRFLRVGRYFPFSWTSTQNYNVVVEGSSDGITYSTFTTFTVNNNTYSDVNSINVPNQNGYYIRFRITN